MYLTRINFGKHEFDDGKTVKYKELEIDLNSDGYLVIRMYPSNTIFAHKNTYRKYISRLYKIGHFHAQNNFSKILNDVFSKLRMRPHEDDVAIVVKRFWELVKEPMK